MAVNAGNGVHEVKQSGYEQQKGGKTRECVSRGAKWCGNRARDGDVICYTTQRPWCESTESLYDGSAGALFFSKFPPLGSRGVKWESYSSVKEFEKSKFGEVCDYEGFHDGTPSGLQSFVKELKVLHKNKCKCVSWYELQPMKLF